VPAQYIRGGECCEETPPPAEPGPPTAPPVVQLPSGALKQSTAPIRPAIKTPPLLPQTGASTTCANAVQGKIAWDYAGNKQWGQANINRLCAGAENSAEPARCFERVMHGGVNWGGGTQWQWQNAIDLCQGSRGADATVDCFKAAINEGVAWRQAIDRCKAG